MFSLSLSLWTALAFQNLSTTTTKIKTLQEKYNLRYGYVQVKILFQQNVKTKKKYIQPNYVSYVEMVDTAKSKRNQDLH